VSNRGYEQHTTYATYCLGQPPHLVEHGKIICGACGRLVRGATLGIYQVQRLLGQGRSGDAYLAHYHRRQQQVVMKVFPPDRATMGLWEAARQEALLLARLQHPSLLPVYSCSLVQLEAHATDARPLDGESVSSPAKGNAYLLTVRPFAASTLSHVLMRLVQGEILVSNKDDHALPLKFIQQIGETLSFAHARGIAHGALVPGNLLVDERAHCWIADFGLARLHPPPSPYLPPELLYLFNNDQSAERFVALWNATTPLSDQYMFAVLCQTVLSEQLFPQNYAVVMRVLQRATAPYPESRFPSIDAFVQALVEAMPMRKRLQASDRTFNPRAPTISDPLARDAQTADEGDTGTPSSRQMPLAQAADTLGERVKGLERLGGKLFTDHRYQQALQTYHQALALDAGNATIWMALGDTYLAIEHYTEALSAYEKSIALYPKDAETWTNCGTVLEVLGRRREAQVCYERASQLRNEEPSP
jgi:serine/threonine protein kinase